MKHALRLFFALVLAFLPSVRLAAAGQATGPNSFVSVANLAATVGMKVRSTGPSGHTHYTLSSDWATIEIEEGKRTCTLNGVTLHLARPPITRGTLLYMMRGDYEKTLQPLILPQRSPAPPRLRTIAIDAGHGGRDNGAENKSLRLREKDLTLDLAMRLKALLEDRGYNVVLTRSRDEFIALDDRPARAARAGADLFISLHLNASTDTSVRGAETYILPPAGQPSTGGEGGDFSLQPGNRFDEWSVVAAYYVQRGLENSVGAQDRGVRRARFAVLRPLTCPGMLIESGFVSNSAEGAQLGSAAYRQKIASAIADAVDAYSRTLRRVATQAK